MATASTSFSAVGAGTALSVSKGESFTLTITGTWVGTVVLQRRIRGNQWENVSGESYTANQAAKTISVVVGAFDDTQYRMFCTAYTSGTIVTALADVADAGAQSLTLKDRQYAREYDDGLLLGEDTTNYAKYDIDNKRFLVANSQAGGDSPRAMYVDVDVLAGNGYRQGAINIAVDRALGEDVVWDGNPDTAIKIAVNNRAANAANEGAVRGIDVSARNRGADASWANGGSINARNDSGSTIYQLIGIQTRLENYGTCETELIGLDVNLSCENDTGAPTKTGIVIRNTDQSAQGAVDEAVKISHTSTNGFDAFLTAAGATGDGMVASAATPTGNAASALIVRHQTTLLYIPCYAAVGFGG